MKPKLNHATMGKAFMVDAPEATPAITEPNDSRGGFKRLLVRFEVHRWDEGGQLPSPDTRRRARSFATVLPAWVSRLSKRAKIATLTSFQTTGPLGVLGCEGIGTITPSADITSGSVASSSAKGSGTTA